MKLSEMKQILVEGEIQLTKSLGQNFLHDANQLRRIVGLAELRKSDCVLEVGPGLGPLTELLLQETGTVLAIEKDARLVEVLKRRFQNVAEAGNPKFELRNSKSGPESIKGENPGLHLFHDDALDYLKREARDWSGWKLVANLPYSVASPILVELALAKRGPERMVATLQIEVAKRLMASSGDEDYGVLTLLVQQDYIPQGWFKIPASCFFPAPDVDSACVCLARREHALLAPEHRDTFTRVVKRSFSQRRKMMLKLLKQDWSAPALEQAFQTVQLSPQVRAESVSLEQFAQLARVLHEAD
ncbi:MAG TPA: 16S rRNA (adenine(1518)-N(6)/adenine(1519)-N(6))-dimethyltransferase RsmA [Bacillota bacterium]|nr:16S rRNA (adenine(1518)-N(6)/adenine(1519)-N(6))-dimethyltransferase RsmA [Bacillota bacterium]